MCENDYNKRIAILKKHIDKYCKPYDIPDCISSITNGQYTISEIKKIISKHNIPVDPGIVKYIYRKNNGLCNSLAEDDKQYIYERFKEVCFAHYEKYIHSDKRSFFPYNFVIRKLLQELDPAHEALSLFPPPNSILIRIGLNLRWKEIHTIV